MDVCARELETTIAKSSVRRLSLSEKRFDCNGGWGGYAVILGI